MDPRVKPEGDEPDRGHIMTKTNSGNFFE
ncbi:MAG: hypothetical protein FD125_3087, partial [bacterium]